MNIRITRGLLAALFAVVALAGCMSSGDAGDTTGADTGGAASGGSAADTAPQTPPTVTPPPRPTTDAAGNPLDDDGQPIARTVYFDFDRSELKPRARSILSQHAKFLTENRGRRITVEGHCDERGTREYNLALGERRAAAVQNYLTSMGVRSSQITVVSYGEERPVDPRHNEDAWAKNRRGELLYR